MMLAIERCYVLISYIPSARVQTSVFESQMSLVFLTTCDDVALLLKQACWCVCSPKPTGTIDT